MIVGVDGAGKECAAICLGRIPALPDGVRALEAVQLLSSTASPVGVVRVLALTGTA